MTIQHLPDALLSPAETSINSLTVRLYNADSHQNKLKINLTGHVFSFLTSGQKEVHFSDTIVSVTSSQALLISAGNCLMTERLSDVGVYRSTLFFFTPKNVADFLVKYATTYPVAKPLSGQAPYFVIEQDEFITYFVKSLAVHTTLANGVLPQMLDLKFEEIMLYLVAQYGDSFLFFLQTLVSNADDISFRKVIEANVFSKLSLEEIAFLCNMSLSTFKRHFIGLYHETPGKWFQHRRLLRAKELLQKGDVKASDIFWEFGYESLSNFSAAFKQEFGITPRQAVLS